ncbi:MAG: ATP-dependent DNA helicase [Clostridia bacterium]|nr:ATP-dependent DNA helicase [Clostridia bacterium]
MHYNPQTDFIEISVRELCALAFKGGSLDNRVPPVNLYRRAEEGREVHGTLRALREAGRGPGMPEGQSKKRPRGSEEAFIPAEETPKAAYHAEVTLSHTCRMDGVTFLVSGRADGVWFDPMGGCMVEEIKSVAGMADYYLPTPREADLAQLSCYGYFLCAAKGLSTVTLRLTYARPGHEEEASCVDSVMTAEQLKGLYAALLQAVLPRAKDLYERETTLRSIAKRAIFPYAEVREAQQDMIRECWRDMRAGKTLFAEAPTGIGKTMATLYPAVRCFGEGRCDKIFYLTAKNATRREAFSAVQKLGEAATPIRACVITARESACICEAAKAGGNRLSTYCNPDSCPYAKGYYDKVESVIFDLLSSGKTVFSGLDIRAAAKKWDVCPYELALDLSELCEIIICDYNYVFSPSVYLRRYFADGIPHTAGHRYMFLVDEAHNLPDRARDMYSGALSLTDVMAAQDALHAWESEVGKHIFPDEDYGESEEDVRAPRLKAASLDDLVGVLSRMVSTCAESMVVDDQGVRHGVSLDRNQPVVLCNTALELSTLCDRWLRRNQAHPLYPVVDRLATALRAFRTASEHYDRRFATFVEVEGEDVRVRLTCLDPAGILRPLLQKAEARILFSATLTPNDYYADVLGGDRDSVLVNFDSPFPRDHLCVAVCDGVSTRYEDRDKSCRKIMNYIAATISARRGNYMVYFPSYAYLEKVYALFRKKYPSVKAVVQKPGMTYAEREAFIASFTPDSNELLVGFCVLGGSFSEGVDLPGRCLIGTVIVGVGIPALSNERNIMREYFDETRVSDSFETAGGGEGYAYAYTYPGMTHVLQAAGRVIRRPEDYGVVVLLDDRYAGEPYLHLYPEHWEQVSAVEDATSLYEYLAAFWEEIKNET